MLWCNGPVRDRSLCLQADVGTSGRIMDDDALSSCWTGDDAVVADSHSSRSVVTRGWSSLTGCSSPYEYHTGRQAATSLSRRCSAESDDFLAVVRGTADCDPLEVDPWAVVRGTDDDELLAAPRRILRVEKPVDISTVVQGTVSCRLVAAIPSCEGVCIFRRVGKFF